MQREKEELVDGPYRRDFLTYDNHVLDGEIFLQVSIYYLYSFLEVQQFLKTSRNKLLCRNNKRNVVQTNNSFMIFIVL